MGNETEEKNEIKEIKRDFCISKLLRQRGKEKEKVRRKKRKMERLLRFYGKDLPVQRLFKNNWRDQDTEKKKKRRKRKEKKQKKRERLYHTNLMNLSNASLFSNFHLEELDEIKDQKNHTNSLFALLSIFVWSRSLFFLFLLRISWSFKKMKKKSKRFRTNLLFLSFLFLQSIQILFEI